MVFQGFICFHGFRVLVVLDKWEKTLCRDLGMSKDMLEGKPMGCSQDV